MRVKWFAPVFALCTAALCMPASCGGGPSNDFAFYYIASDGEGTSGFLYLAGGTGSDVKWNYLVNTDGEVENLDFSSDGTEAILQTTTLADGPGLYLADLTSHTGGQLLKVNSPFEPFSAYLDEVQFMPDDRWIVFTASAVPFDTQRIFAVNVENGFPDIPADLAPSQTPDENVLSFDTGALGDLVFRADLDGSPADLYYVSLRGNIPTAPVRLTTGGGHSYGFTPDGTLFLYRAADGKIHIAGFGPGGVEMNSTVTGSRDGAYIAFAPDSSRIAYEDGYNRILYGIDLNGGKSPRHYQIAWGVWGWGFTPDSRRLVYIDDSEIYFVDFDGTPISAPVKINSNEHAIFNGDFAIAPNGKFVVYFKDDGSNYYSGDLYIAPIAEKAEPFAFKDQLAFGDGAYQFIISADSSRVIISAKRFSYATEVIDTFEAPANNGHGGTVRSFVNIDPMSESGLSLAPLMMFAGNSPLLYDQWDQFNGIPEQIRVADLSKGFPLKSSAIYPQDPLEPHISPRFVGWIRDQDTRSVTGKVAAPPYVAFGSRRFSPQSRRDSGTVRLSHNAPE